MYDYVFQYGHVAGPKMQVAYKVEVLPVALLAGHA